MMEFDFDLYKKQCSAVADAFKQFDAARLSFEDYAAILAKQTLLTPKVIDKIEKEFLLKGSAFRPIDAYQF